MEYKEYHLTLGEVDFTFFLDGGFYQTDFYSSEEHSHKYSEILYVVSGEVSILSEGVEYHITKGGLAVIPKDTLHATKGGVGACFTFISFWDSAELLDGILTISPFGAAQAFLRLLDYYYQTHTYKRELICACLMEILVHILENLHTGIKAEMPQGAEGTGYRKYTVEHYMNTSYNSSPSLRELASRLHLCLGQTERIVRQMYGMTFEKKILAIRMEHAKVLLLDTTLPICEIATRVGYTTTHNFFAKFKDYTGKTPGAYRRAGGNQQ